MAAIQLTVHLESQASASPASGNHSQTSEAPLPVTIEPASDTAALTICASNFLGKALVLRRSYLDYHREHDFYILIIEKKNDGLAGRLPGVRILWAEDLGIECFLGCALKFDIVELCTNVKPAAMRRLLAHYHKVIYLDPDIRLYAALSPVFEPLNFHCIVVTPHALTPVMDGESPSDIDFLRFGAFNLGFMAVRQDEEAFAFLEWWSKRCLAYGFYEPQLGLAVDQKWIDLAPALFAGVKILRDPGLNVAFWNLHERRLSRCGGRWMVNRDFPLRFFHFSSFNPRRPQSIAEKQSRFAAGSRPDLGPLLEDYAAELEQSAQRFSSGAEYGFDYFENGIYIPPSLRRFYAALESKFPPGENPFADGSALQKFALSRGLAGSKYQPCRRATFKDLGSYSTLARMFALGLKTALRVLGPNRYFSLMKYLAHISSIRNQSGIFPDVS